MSIIRKKILSIIDLLTISTIYVKTDFLWCIWCTNLLFRRRKREGCETNHGSHGTLGGRDEENQQLLWWRKHWVFGHCIGLDGPLAACFRGGGVRQDLGPTQIPCHGCVGPQVHHPPFDQTQLASTRRNGCLLSTKETSTHLHLPWLI